jgi:hypothetical protein
MSDGKVATVFDLLVAPMDSAGGKRQRGGLGRWRRDSPAKGRGQAVAEVEVGDEPSRGAAEEAGVAQVFVDPLEGAVRGVQLQHGPNATRSAS